MNKDGISKEVDGLMRTIEDARALKRRGRDYLYECGVNYLRATSLF